LSFELAETGHALVGALVPKYDLVAKISIIPRDQAGCLTFFAPKSILYNRSYLENQMIVAFGGTWGFHAILLVGVIPELTSWLSI
jgi:ATP-dependent Zn protease